MWLTNKIIQKRWQVHWKSRHQYLPLAYTQILSSSNLILLSSTLLFHLFFLLWFLLVILSICICSWHFSTDTTSELERFGCLLMDTQSGLQDLNPSKNKLGLKVHFWLRKQQLRKQYQHKVHLVADQELLTILHNLHWHMEFDFVNETRTASSAVGILLDLSWLQDIFSS